MSRNDECLISIIVPVYNVCEYIDKCVESILTQTYKHLEIILVDDGSNDGSEAKCDTWAEKESRITVVHKTNGGLVSARKTGLSLVHGQYVGFVDSDDYIEPDMYKRLTDTINCDDLDFVYCSAYKENSTTGKKRLDNTITGIFDIGKENGKGVSFIKEHLLMAKRCNQMYTGGIVFGLYRTHFIKSAYDRVPNDCSQGEDLVCLIYMLLSGNRFSIIEDKLYNYVIRTSSMSHNKSYRKYIESCKMMDEVSKICKSENVYNELEEAIYYYLNRIITFDVCSNNPTLEANMYYYPNSKKIEGKKIIIYGAGQVGKSYFSQLSANDEICVLAWVDKNYNSLANRYVSSVDSILNDEYDYIVIAVNDMAVAGEIKDELEERGIDRNKMLFELPEFRA